MQQVAVSILNYNSATSTIACVNSLIRAAQAACDHYSLQVFIADNASDGADQGFLLQKLEQKDCIHVQVNSENLGFAAGHNRNLRTIFGRSSPDFIWILNSDCLPDSGALTALLASAQQRPEVGIWGATLLESDAHTIQCAGGCFYNTWISSYRQYGRGKQLSQLDQLSRVDFNYIAGASLFFPVATLQHGLQAVPGSTEKLGVGEQQWLNERFFLYFEELDLVQRLKPGLKIAWCKEALIQHAGGKSSGTTGRNRTAVAEYHSTLSALKFTQIYYPRRLWVMAVARYMSKSLLLLARGEIRLLGPLTRAYRDFLLG